MWLLILSWWRDGELETETERKRKKRERRTKEAVTVEERTN